MPNAPLIVLHELSKNYGDPSGEPNFGEALPRFCGATKGHTVPRDSVPTAQEHREQAQ